jgi:hypothetical protein
MNNPAEWIFFLLLLLALPGLFGFCSLRVIHFIVSRVRNVSYRLLILLGLIVINWILFLRFDATAMIMGSFLLGIPASVLIPKFGFPSNENVPVTLSRIIPCYFFVWLGVDLFFLYFGWSGLFMLPFFFWDTPLSNGVLYASLIAGCIGLAALLYWLMNRWNH